MAGSAAFSSRWGIKGHFNTPLAVIIALTFVGLPFVVRTLQPVLENLEQEIEEAGRHPGRQPVPHLHPDFGADFVSPRSSPASRSPLRAPSGSTAPSPSSPATWPYKTEIVPSLIVYQIEEHNYCRGDGHRGGFAGHLLRSSSPPINWLEVWTHRQSNEKFLTNPALPSAHPMVGRRALPVWKDPSATSRSSSQPA